jgi:hypothetical protein
MPSSSSAVEIRQLFDRDSCTYTYDPPHPTPTPFTPPYHDCAGIC